MTRIELLRRKQGMNKTQLADALGVSGSAVSQWESGSKPPSAENCAKMAKLFGVSVEYIRGLEEAPTFPKGLSKALTDTVMELTIEECSVLRSLIDARILQLKVEADKAAKE